MIFPDPKYDWPIFPLAAGKNFRADLFKQGKGLCIVVYHLPKPKPKKDRPKAV